MRWPFHFGKAARADGDAVPQAAAPPRRRDWASVAPIQRAIGDAPLTAHSLEFRRSLAGSEAPPLSLETLGHHRSPEGPQGLVMGIADPIATYASTAELIGRPRRRAEAAAGVQATSWGHSSAPEADFGPPATQDEDSEPDVPSRMLPAVPVEPPGTPTPVSRLTDASRVELGPLRPVQRSPETAAQVPPTEAGGAPPVNQPAPGLPAGTRLNLGLSRRHGLGAPIRSTEVAAVQRSAEPAASPAVPPPAEVQRAPAETPAAAEPQTGAPLAVSELSHQPGDEDRFRAPIPAEGLAPLPPIRRQGGRGNSDGPDSILAAEEAGTAPDAPSAGPEMQGHGSAVPIGPALGSAPASIQRLMGTGPSRPGLRESRTAPESHRTTPTVPLAPFRPPLTTIRMPGEPQLVGMTGGQPSRSFGAAGDMPQPATQRSPALAWSPSGAPGGGSGTHAFRAPEPGPLVWNVQRLAPGEAPAAEPMAGAPSAGQSPSAGTPMMAAAPAPAPTAGAAPGSGGGAGGAPHPGEAPAPGGGAAGGQGGGAPAGGAAPHGDKELYELAQALFHPLMSLLRREVLTERERAGFVTDLR